jgi:hypothetical protein
MGKLACETHCKSRGYKSTWESIQVLDKNCTDLMKYYLAMKRVNKDLEYMCNEKYDMIKNRKTVEYFQEISWNVYVKTDKNENDFSIHFRNMENVFNEMIPKKSYTIIKTNKNENDFEIHFRNMENVFNEMIPKKSYTIIKTDKNENDFSIHFRNMENVFNEMIPKKSYTVIKTNKNENDLTFRSKKMENVFNKMILKESYTVVESSLNKEQNSQGDKIIMKFFPGISISGELLLIKYAPFLEKIGSHPHIWDWSISARLKHQCKMENIFGEMMNRFSANKSDNVINDSQCTHEKTEKNNKHIKFPDILINQLSEEHFIMHSKKMGKIHKDLIEKMNRNQIGFFGRIFNRLFSILH